MSNSSSYMTIPNRWLDCPRRGSIIANKFLPFKTPLDSRYNGAIPAAKRFNLEMLFGFANTMSGRLKLIIDLTNTNRFYSSEEVERHGVSYVKLACRGHGETPDLDQTRTFIAICNRVLSTPSDDPTKPNIVGVHCTHGFNRTGFLICAYLVEEDGWSLADAMNFFAQARPPGIYKQDYIDQLVKIYNDGDGVGFNAPPLPSWCFEGSVEVPDNTAVVENGIERSERSFSSAEIEQERENAQRKDVVTLCPGVVPAEVEHWHSVRRAVAEYLGWKGSGFAGSQPVSFDRESFKKLGSKQYLVSWKADGTRYMMYINDQGKVFLLDRDNCVFYVPRLEFPRRPKQPNEPPSHLVNTLMDGELVVDKMPDGSKQPRYLVYDLVILNGQSLVSFLFPRRVELLKREVISYRDQMAVQGRLDKASQPFSVRVKDFFGIAKSRDFMSPKFASQVSHGVDGLIFQPADEPYFPGRCDTLLKWKPSVENTIDFRLRIVKNDPNVKPKPGELPPPNNIGDLLVGMGRGQEKMVERIKLTKELRQLNDRIIECAYDTATKEWKFTRERVDKSYPNAYETAMGVFRSISDPVTSEQLFAFVDKLPSNLTNGRFESGGKQPQQQQLQPSSQSEQPKKRPAPAPPPPLFNESESPKKMRESATDNGSQY